MTGGAFRVSDEANGRRVSGGGIWRAGAGGAPVGHYVVETDSTTDERRVVCYLEPAWRTAQVAIATAVRSALATTEEPAPAIRFNWLAGSAASGETAAAPVGWTGEARGRGAAESELRPAALSLGSSMDQPAPREPKRLPPISPYLPASGSVAVGALLLASYVYRLLAFVGIDESGSTLWQTVLAGFLCLVAGLVCVILGSTAAYLGNAALLAAIGALNVRRAGGVEWDSLLPFAAALLHGAAALLTTRASRAAGG